MRLFIKKLSISLLMLILSAGLLGGCQKKYEDGTYSVEIEMEGGTGKASIESPAELTVENQNATVKIVWSSIYYDYMIVDGVKYLNENEGGNSTFTVPIGEISKLDEPFEIVADTTAMSMPHEIDYTLYFTLVDDDN